MKNNKKCCIILVILTIIMCGIISEICKNNTVLAQQNDYVASSMIVMDSNSGRVLYQKNANKKSYMASTTKILTAITVIENCNINDNFTITSECVGIEGSSIYLRKDEVFSIKDLLYGLMLRSGNDCAVALSIACSNSTDNFVKLMNKTAQKIGAKDSNFTNPHGLHDDNHYTTAYDLALISCYAMKNEVFKDIVSTKSVRIPLNDKNSESCRLLINKNKMLSNLDGCNGIKTGYTKKAGRCLVTSCQRNDLNLVCVVLNCGPMWQESADVLNYCFNQYKNYLIADKNNIAGFVKIENSDFNCATYIKKDVVLPLTEQEYHNLKIEYDLPKTLPKNTKKDTNIGNIKVYIQNNLIFTEKIYTIVDV